MADPTPKIQSNIVVYYSHQNVETTIRIVYMFEVENGISNIVHVTSLGESYDHDDKFILVTSSYIHIPTEIFLYITVILICTVSRHIARKSFSLQFSALQEILSQLQF